MEDQGQHIFNLLKQGDEEGINKLFSFYFAPMCAVALRIVRNPDTAKDIVQDVFVRLWTNRERLQITSSLQGYLKQSVTNACIDLQRRAYEKTKVRLEEATTTQLASGLGEGKAADHNIESQELTNLVNQAISSLPDRCRLVFTLSRHEGLTYNQIAKKLEISPKTVENQMSKALKTLRILLASALTSTTTTLLIFHFLL